MIKLINPFNYEKTFRDLGSGFVVVLLNMGFLKKLFGSKENNNQKLPSPLLSDEQ